MKPLHARLKDINTEELYMKTLSKFLKTKKGQEMIQFVDTMSIDSLITRFEAPKFPKSMAKRLGPTRRKNILRSAMKAIGVRVTVKRTGMPNYSEVLYAKQKNGELKLAPSLTKDEQKRLNRRDQWVIKRDKLGNPIVKTEKSIREGELAPRRLFDATSGKPIYKYTPRPKPMGIAFKCHAYEEHKMKKWDKKHPAPTAIELANDLFPEYLISAHESFREKALENIRKHLSDLYCPVTITVMTKNDKTDIVRKIECERAIRLKKISSDLLSHKTPLKPELINRIRDIAENVKGTDRVTCVHLHCHNPAQGAIIMPDILRMAA